MRHMNKKEILSGEDRDYGAGLREGQAVNATDNL